MKNAILIPGRPDKDEYYDQKYPTNSNNHWFPWLSKQLQINDVFAVAIEPPMPWQPRYDIWELEFEKFDITPETVMVGYSRGGFLVRWLSSVTFLLHQHHAIETRIKSRLFCYQILMKSSVSAQAILNYCDHG